jgi:hypothetical protein
MHACNSTTTDALETHFANLHLTNSSQAFASVHFAISAQPKKTQPRAVLAIKVPVPSFHFTKHTQSPFEHLTSNFQNPRSHFGPKA